MSTPARHTYHLPRLEVRLRPRPHFPAPRGSPRERRPATFHFACLFIVSKLDVELDPGPAGHRYRPPRVRPPPRLPLVPLPLEHLRRPPPPLPRLRPVPILHPSRRPRLCRRHYTCAGIERGDGSDDPDGGGVGGAAQPDRKCAENGGAEWGLGAGGGDAMEGRGDPKGRTGEVPGGEGGPEWVRRGVNAEGAHRKRLTIHSRTWRLGQGPAARVAACHTEGIRPTKGRILDGIDGGRARPPGDRQRNFEANSGQGEGSVR